MKTHVCSLLKNVKLCAVAIIAGAALAPISGSGASPMQLLSARDQAIVLPVGGNGDSAGPGISGNGRFVVFSSSANDLATNANGPFGLNVFLRDRSRNTTLLISANSSDTRGGNGDSILGQVSSYGRFVAFQSDASDIVAGDTNGVSDIFLRDTFTGTTRLISVAANGGFGNGASTEPIMTPDGTCVAFVSAANNLVANDLNGIPDVFVRDLITQTTWLISVGATTNMSSYIPPIMATPAITPDGRFVAFFSTALSLAPGVSMSSLGEIYLRDRLAGTTVWASTNASTTVNTLLHLNWMPSVHPALSDDGRYVAFKTGWTNGVAAPASPGVPAVIVFIYDTLTRTATMVSTNGYPPWQNCDDVYGPETTPDGRFLAYVEREPVGGTNGSSVRLWDQQTGTNVLVSGDPGGAWLTNSLSHTPALSQDGRYVTFLSDATNLVANIVSNGVHIYRRDLLTSTTVLMDVDTNGIGSADVLGAIPALSADGQHAAFSALDGGLIGSDNNRVQDVLVWNAAAGTNELISLRNPAVLSRTADAVSAMGPISLSGDGSRAAFASYARDLVPNDFNKDCDVFVREAAGGYNILVSVGLDGNAGLGGPAHSPGLSADGRYVVFVSSMTNLLASKTNSSATDIFRRDLLLNTNELVSVDSSGINLGNGDSTSPVISQDGRYIAFFCRTNTSTSPTNVFWRDMISGITRLVTGGSTFNRALSLSADGQRLAYFGKQSYLYVWDAALQADIYTNTTASLTSAAIAPDGTRLLYQTTNQLFVGDLVIGTNVALYPSTVQLKGPSPWSADGRRIVFVTRANLVAGDSNGTNDVYLHDLLTGALTLVSMNASRSGSAAGASDWPAISADGRFVAFRSFAADVLPGIVKPPSLVVYDRLSTSNNLISTGTAAGWASWLCSPLISTDGDALAFHSWDSGLVTGDLNRAADVFASDLGALPPWDTDGDGIADWWTRQYFGHSTGQAGDLSRAVDDADGDGMNNLEEYLAGTIPTSGASVLALRLTDVDLAGNVLLGWDAVPARFYQVLSTTNLSDQAWEVFPGNVSVIGSQGYFNGLATDAPRYFRILCTP
jgi:Tol biopolymer transport system component